MKNYYLSSILMVLFISISGICEAQQSILAAGNNAQSAAGSVAYSVGQIFYETQESATGKVNAGVQQPYEIFPLATNENSLQNKITVYPNPVKDFLIVDFNSEKLEKSSYQLFDGTGRIINKGELKNLKTEINTSTLSSGLYMLSISSEGKMVKTFKIIKNK
ncbi:MAG: T9SS type A sorting domain-containing protein [Flavobacteriales bacterium]|nr:T9SS type A sorting domain-containing protein [Flavobacteriales bacterium]